MVSRTSLRPGGTYMLHDYTLVQVVSLTGGRVRYRLRPWTWRWRRRPAERTGGEAQLVARVRAEINGDFFPDFSRPGPYRFTRGADDAARLDGVLAERAPRRPFSGES